MTCETFSNNLMQLAWDLDINKERLPGHGPVLNPSTQPFNHPHHLQRSSPLPTVLNLGNGVEQKTNLRWRAGERWTGRQDRIPRFVGDTCHHPHHAWNISEHFWHIWFLLILSISLQSNIPRAKSQVLNKLTQYCPPALSGWVNVRMDPWMNWFAGGWVYNGTF